MKNEDFESRMHGLVAMLHASDFIVEKIDDDPENLKLVLSYKGAIYEIRSFRRSGAQRMRRDFLLPERFFEEQETVLLRGHRFPCMGPLNEYLTYCYGDWETPVRTARKSKYLSTGYFHGTRIKRFAKAFCRKFSLPPRPTT